jgi:hypothetical protein
VKDYIEVIADDEGISGTKDVDKRKGLLYVHQLIEGEKISKKGKRIKWVAAVHINRLTRDPWLIIPGKLAKACSENDVRISTLTMDFNLQRERDMRIFMQEAEESARHLKWMIQTLGGRVAQPPH